MLGILPGEAALMVTRAEDSNAYVSSVTGTRVFDFNSQTAGATATNITWMDGSTTVGTIDQVRIFAGDQWGGAGNPATNYAGQQGQATTTLSLSTPNAYFGMWWSAGDAFNRLTFYHGAVLIAEFTTSTLLANLPAEYFGNPRNNQNTSEAYAFINFFGMGGTSWDRIVFSNSSYRSNFESDNWTTRVQPWGSLPGEGPTPPGTPVVTIATPTVIPEPSSLVAALTSALLLCLRRRR